MISAKKSGRLVSAKRNVTFVSWVFWITKISARTVSAEAR